MEIREIHKDENEETLTLIKQLFVDMYDYMEACGMQSRLAKNGSDTWLRSIRLTLGRMNYLFIAQQDNKIVGFAHGIVRIGPGYLGNEKSGHIAHVYTTPNLRLKGVGKQLVAQLETKLQDKGTTYINLDVVNNNQAALEFWQRLGYKKDLYQMRKNS